MLLPKSINNPKGFTLIELMVVITIIAILAVTGFVVYSSISARGRDVKRISEIDAIQKAMEKNYQPGDPNPYPALSPSDFVNAAVPLDPSTGSAKCGASNKQVCEYCFYAKDTVQANDIGEAAGDCGTMSGVAGTKAADGKPAVSTGYVVCANLETKAGSGGKTYYCKSNAQ